MNSSSRRSENSSMAGLQSSSGVKFMVSLLAFVLVLYILGPPLLHLIEEGSPIRVTSCPACVCDCISEGFMNLHTSDLGNVTFSDCNPEADMRDELDKSQLELLTEEFELQKVVALEKEQRAEAAFLDAKKIASQYQKEAEKCNAGMETSEEAREKAEAALTGEKKRSAMWERRARSLGWKDEEVATGKLDANQANPDGKTLKGKGSSDIPGRRTMATVPRDTKHLRKIDAAKVRS